MRVKGAFSFCTTDAMGTYIKAPCPSDFKHELFQIMTESNRTVGQGAYLNMELLATKNKFNYTWNYLEAEDYQILCNLRYNVKFFWIQLVDPLNPKGGLKTFHVYGGDLGANAVRIDDETGKTVAWKDVTWNLIER